MNIQVLMLSISSRIYQIWDFPAIIQLLQLFSLYLRSHCPYAISRQLNRASCSDVCLFLLELVDTGTEISTSYQRYPKTALVFLHRTYFSRLQCLFSLDLASPLRPLQVWLKPERCLWISFILLF